MNKLNLKNIAENFLDTFLNAGNVAKKISQKGVKIKIKDDKSPVTDGDLAVDKILKAKIEILTPNIPIISEETVDLKTGVKKEITIRPIKNSDFVERFSDMRGTQLNATLHSN